MLQGRSFTALLLASMLGAPLSAQAQPAAVEQHAEEEVEHSDDDIRLQLTAGLTGAYGNARNVAFNLAAGFVLRQGQHSFLADASWIYGLAATRIDPTGTPPDNTFGNATENTNNFNARLRYDFFITLDDAIFVVAKTRYDPFARLEPRVTGQAGYLRNLLREENHRFWVEAGYDFTYDNFGGDLLDVGGGVLSTDRTLNSLRLFVGYENRINPIFTYVTGFEALMQFDKPEHWRFEWINQFRSAIEEWLQISLDVTGRFDSLPPGQAVAWNEQPNQATQMFDLLVTFNLVGTIDFYSPPPPEEEDECECPEPECPEPEAEPEPEGEPAAAEPEGEQEPEPVAPEGEPAP